MTVQQYLDHLARKILQAADDGSMPPDVKQQFEHLLERVRREIDLFGRVQMYLPYQILEMDWDEFAARIDKHRQVH